MIEVTRLNDTKIFLNPALIETVEQTPDTVVIFNSGKKFLVKESPQDLERKFSNFLAGSIYKALVHAGANVSLNPRKKES